MDSSRLKQVLSRNTIIDKESLDKIPIIECGERMVQISNHLPSIIPRMSKYRAEFSGGQTLWVRETLVNMLAEAVRQLEPYYRLVMYDAYRPIAYQQQRYQQVYNDIKQRHPESDESTIEQLAFHVVFPPDTNPQKSPPHATGGAIDVTLIIADGSEIDMGSRYGHYSNDDENERHMTNSKLISETQYRNRQILIAPLVEAGFCNYPGEWWHFMYGDREYAAYEGLSHAVYGRADLLEGGL